LQVGNRRDQSMMFDAISDADEVHARALGSFAINPAVANVHRARRVDLRALQAQAQDIGRGLGANLVERARDCVEHTTEAKMLDQRGNSRRSIGRQPKLVAPLELEHERAQLDRRPQHLEERRLIHVARHVVHRAELGRVASRTRRKHLARSVRDGRDFLVSIKRRFADLCENPVVVGDVRFRGIEQNAVGVEHHQFNHADRFAIS
jgi:hypothetical protein